MFRRHVAGGSGDIPQTPDNLTVADGFGNVWQRCALADCSLEVVRPGKAQCDDVRVLTEFGWEWVPPCVWGDDWEEVRNG